MRRHHRKIISLHKKGMLIEDIAKTVFRGKRAVEHVISRAIKDGLLTPRWGTTRGGRKEQIIEMMLAGKRPSQIARDLELTPSAVAGVLYRYRGRVTTHPESTNETPHGPSERPVQVPCVAG